MTQTDTSGTTTYMWDTRNRLTGISGPSLSAGFAYDAVGRRLSRHVLSQVEGTVNGRTTTFLYDGLGIVRESGAGGDASYLRTLSIDEAVSRSAGGSAVSYVSNILGSTVALADGSGVLATTYTPFGETSGAGPPAANAVQYTGRENDGTGLCYYRARFVAEGPLGMVGGDLNLYHVSCVRVRPPAGVGGGA